MTFATPPRAHHLYFSGWLPRPSCHPSGAISFTLKYRTAATDSWTWTNDIRPIGDGQLHFPAPTLAGGISGDLEDYFSIFNRDLDVKHLASEAPDTRLWSLSSVVSFDGGDKAVSTARIPLGVPLDVVRWFAIVRQWEAWMAPQHGKGAWRTEKPALMSSFLRRDGIHVVMLAMNGLSDTTTLLEDDGFGAVVIDVRSDGVTKAEATVLVALGYTHETALAACMYHARRMVQSSIDADSMASTFETPSKRPKSEKVEGRWSTTQAMLNERFQGKFGQQGMRPDRSVNQSRNHALQDYQIQLMLLEQQNRERLLMAGQKLDRMRSTDNQIVNQLEATSALFMSPQSSHSVPELKPNEMKREDTKTGQTGLPGSPMLGDVMPPNRCSPGPVNFNGQNMSVETMQKTQSIEEKWWDGLGYSTWNALGPELTASKLLHALDNLGANGIRVSTLFIDDGWQSVDPSAHKHSSAWREFEADEAGLPSGLKRTVSNLRALHPYVEHIGVWHALMGYWNGISPAGPIDAAYDTMLVHKQESEKLPPGKFAVVTVKDAESLYDDFYQFLRKCGISCVKTDVQCQPNMLAEPTERGTLERAYQRAWTQAHLKNLSGRAIACMAHVPSSLFRTHLPTNRPPALLRTSDDFFPDEPRSHGWHVFANAAMGLFVQYLNVVPDWDMFQTKHDFGPFHAAARCLSGGPIVITDKPGKHDVGLLRQVVAETVQGKSIALRPDEIGMTVPSGIYTAHGEPRLLKIGAYHGPAETGTGILGVFNVGESALAEFVRLQDFPGILENHRYVVRAYSSGSVVGPVTAHVDNPACLLPITLAPGSWEILTVHPLFFVPRKVRVEDAQLEERYRRADEEAHLSDATSLHTSLPFIENKTEPSIWFYWAHSGEVQKLVHEAEKDEPDCNSPLHDASAKQDRPPKYYDEWWSAGPTASSPRLVENVKGHEIEVLGLLDKMTGAAAVTDKQVEAVKRGRYHIAVTLKALGKLGLCPELA